MKSILTNYFTFALHPFKAHRDFRNTPEKEMICKPLPLPELLGISWPFVMIYSIYSVFSITRVASTIKIIPETFAPNIFPQFQNIDFQKCFLIFIVVEAIFFPIIAWIFIKLWKQVIKLFILIFDTPSDDRNLSEVLNQIVNSSLVSNIFLVIPVFGDSLKQLFSMLYLFSGLKNNLGMSTIQALIVIISPVLLLMLMLFVVIMLVMILFMSAGPI